LLASMHKNSTNSSIKPNNLTTNDDENFTDGHTWYLKSIN
jgi:hypothetical protein